MGKFLVFETMRAHFTSIWRARADQPNTIKLIRIEQGIITALISTMERPVITFLFQSWKDYFSIQTGTMIIGPQKPFRKFSNCAINHKTLPHQMWNFYCLCQWNCG